MKISIGVYAPLGIDPACQFWILQAGHGWFLPSVTVALVQFNVAENSANN
jgi:hypothetical protein